MGDENGKSKDKEAVRFYYDKEKVIQAIRGLYPVSRGSIIIGFALLFFIVALTIAAFQPYRHGWEIWAVTLFFIFIEVAGIGGLLDFEIGEKRTGDGIIKGLGPEEKLYIEINQEGLSIPAGLIDIEEAAGNLDLLKRILPIPSSDIRWAGIGIGGRMFKNLIVVMDKEVPLFNTKNLAIDTCTLKEPVERIADVLLSRGVVVKVVWCQGSPFGHYFDGFQPMGPNRRKVVAVNQHEKGRNYVPGDRKKVLARKKGPVVAAK